MAFAIHDPLKDIIGKEFIGIEFSNDGTLQFQAEHTRQIGVIGKVNRVNPSYDRKYTLVDFNNGISLHYFTNDVISQVEEKENSKLKDPQHLIGLYKKVFTELIKISKT